ncbi:type II toxin-antitoxin system YafQ family toxin [Leuconostoc citreum]|uniref:type II toxin-antitoxin system YafQ family toxin n=1 Tax=Leuconostoc citreum TaxID=33964 RepID=UPI00200B8A8D|nr:type II toxin-antitoxin system YafQ family toxin [Leuconostoc citreum]MCK8605744.1 type II toxin-antitoxin system YafQ family toxin [Leuconostoc citreum]
MYKIKQSNQFKKSVKRAAKQGKNIDKLFGVIELLTENKSLPEKYQDHALRGKRWQGIRELHIEPDWLLAYKIDKGELVLLLVDTGSHASMLGM